MRASDILAAHAVDEAGRTLGKVHDIQLTRSSEAEHWRINAIVVGRTALAYRLGYSTQQVRGPAAIAVAVTWLRRKAQVIEWERVTAYDPSRNRLVIRSSG